MYRSLSISVCILLVSMIPHTSLVLANEFRWEVVWRGDEPHFEIHQPAFSLHGDEVTFVRQFHWPDGHEAEFVPEHELTEYRNRLQSDHRFADPEIVIARIGESQVKQVDWGWTPTFSPDGTSLTYAHQKKPISGFRVLAKTLEGNEIRIYNRITHMTKTVAVPESAYFSEPVFSPTGDRILFSFSDAINGAFGGNVGVGCITLETEQMEVLYPPTKDYNLYHILLAKHFVNDNIMVLRLRPEGAGTYLADSYTYELVQVGTPHHVLYSWGTHMPDSIIAGFRINSDGKLQIYDKGWRFLRDKTLSSSQTEEEVGLRSPNDQYVAHVDTESVIIVSREAQEQVYSWKIHDTVQQMTWSPDSQRIAVIITRYKENEPERFLSDQLVILEKQ